MPVSISPSDMCCINIQRSLDEIAGENNPASIKENLGFLDAVMTPRNTQGFEAVPTNSFPGKGRLQSGAGAANRPRLEVKYVKPVRNTVATSKLGLCGDQPQSPDPHDYLDVTVDHTRSLGGKFSKSDFAKLCETPDQRLALNIMQTALDIKRAVNDQLITLAYGFSGLYADGTASTGGTAKDIPILNPAGAINPSSMAVVKSEFRKQHTSTAPIAVGGDILGIFADSHAMGGRGADSLNADPNPNVVTGGVTSFIDFQVDSVIQAIETDTLSHFLAWIPGAYQMLHWYENVGEGEELGKEDYTETTITVDGMKFDFSLHYEKCTKTWNYELTKEFDLWAIPDAAYTQGSAVWNFNRRLHWTLSCGEFSCAAYGL